MPPEDARGFQCCGWRVGPPGRDYHGRSKLRCTPGGGACQAGASCVGIAHCLQHVDIAECYARSDSCNKLRNNCRTFATVAVSQQLQFHRQLQFDKCNSARCVPFAGTFAAISGPDFDGTNQVDDGRGECLGGIGANPSTNPNTNPITNPITNPVRGRPQTASRSEGVASGRRWLRLCRQVGATKNLNQDQQLHGVRQLRNGLRLTYLRR